MRYKRFPKLNDIGFLMLILKVGIVVTLLLCAFKYLRLIQLLITAL